MRSVLLSEHYWKLSCYVIVGRRLLVQFKGYRLDVKVRPDKVELFRRHGVKKYPYAFVCDHSWAQAPDHIGWMQCGRCNHYSRPVDEPI